MARLKSKRGGRQGREHRRPKRKDPKKRFARLIARLPEQHEFCWLLVRFHFVKEEDLDDYTTRATEEQTLRDALDRRAVRLRAYHFMVHAKIEKEQDRLGPGSFPFHKARRHIDQRPPSLWPDMHDYDIYMRRPDAEDLLIDDRDIWKLALSKYAEQAADPEINRKLEWIFYLRDRTNETAAGDIPMEEDGSSYDESASEKGLTTEMEHLEIEAAS